MVVASHVVRWSVVALVSLGTLRCSAFEGVEKTEFYGYSRCIKLSNDRTSVVLCPEAGGRVLEYSLDGTNVLYLPKEGEGWTLSSKQESGMSVGRAMTAGRFDIGPEKTVRRGLELWAGVWEAEVTGPRSARMTSQYDPVSGVQLVREFQLHDSTSQLRCTQTIINQSQAPVSLCHWSRTFAVGGGVAIVPRSPLGRFPNGYVMYENGNELIISPQDPNIAVTDEAVVIKAAPAKPKLGFDSHAGWFAYLAPTEQLFVKRFSTYPNRAYNEFAALTVSIWYPEKDLVELEPIGPAENLKPGERASFSEEWWLLPQRFPGQAQKLNYQSICDLVLANTTAPGQKPPSIVSPEVGDDRRVTFRLAGDPGDVNEVRLVMGSDSWEMRRDVDSVWKYTSPPLSPGWYHYLFEIDGVQVTDPRNRLVKKWLTCKSMFEVRGDELDLASHRDNAHGVIHRHLYDSATTGDQRPAMVYTPPGYDPRGQQSYPVLVLCHGFGDDETAWTEIGRAHCILDNLIAEGEIEPMVVVMPFGHPVPLSSKKWSEDYGRRNSQAMVDDITEDLLPMIEREYNVSSEHSHRGIVGLSMGGGHSIMAGLSHPGKFSWVGAFSAAAPRGKLATGNANLLVKSIAGNDSRKLFWIACGKDDFLFERNLEFVKELQKHGIRHAFVETPGAHSWDVWRTYLPMFLKQVFR